MTRKLRFILLIPVLSVGVYVALHGMAWFDTVNPVVMQAVSFTGCTVAALSFERGDYLRSAWGLYMIGDLLLLVSAALSAAFGLQSMLYPRMACMLLANVAGPAGSYLFGSALALAGLELEAGRWTRRSGMLAGFAVGCVLGGPALYAEVGATVSDGNLNMLIETFGTLGDIANITFTAPIIFTALALRGGRVAWVWSLLSCCLLLWLGYDLLTGLAPAHASLIEGVRVAALSFSGAAGIAQRIVIAPSSTAEAPVA